jgi:hypothetical protein
LTLQFDDVNIISNQKTSLHEGGGFLMQNQSIPAAHNIQFATAMMAFDVFLGKADGFGGTISQCTSRTWSCDAKMRRYIKTHQKHREFGPVPVGMRDWSTSCVRP